MCKVFSMEKLLEEAAVCMFCYVGQNSFLQWLNKSILSDPLHKAQMAMIVTATLVLGVSEQNSIRSANFAPTVQGIQLRPSIWPPSAANCMSEILSSRSLSVSNSSSQTSVWPSCCYQRCEAVFCLFQIWFSRLQQHLILRYEPWDERWHMHIKKFYELPFWALPRSAMGPEFMNYSGNLYTKSTHRQYF